MRIIFKILAAPFVVVFTILHAVLIFLFSISETILNFACGLFILCAIVLMVFMQEWVNGGIILGLAFLISPVGLPRVVDWIIEKIGALNYALRDFIMG